MRIEQYNSLTGDELAMLWGCVNLVEPKTIQGCDVDIEVLTSIKHKQLINKVTNCKPALKEEYHQIIDGLLEKLKV